MWILGCCDCPSEEPTAPAVRIRRRCYTNTNFDYNQSHLTPPCGPMGARLRHAPGNSHHSTHRARRQPPHMRDSRAHRHNQTGIINAASICSYSEPARVVEVAQAAEAAGWEALLIWDHRNSGWSVPGIRDLGGNGRDPGR